MITGEERQDVGLAIRFRDQSEPPAEGVLANLILKKDQKNFKESNEVAASLHKTSKEKEDEEKKKAHCELMALIANILNIHYEDPIAPIEFTLGNGQSFTIDLQEGLSDDLLQQANSDDLYDLKEFLRRTFPECELLNDLLLEIG